MLRIGIDNGKKGAIVAIDENRQCVVSERMPLIPGSMKLDMPGILRVIDDIRARHLNLYAVLEHAQAMPKQGATSGFTLGTGYGAMQMALMARQIPFEIVTPAKWQKTIGVTVPSKIKGKDARRAWIKARVIELVQQRLPTVELVPPRCRVPHDGIADAAAMALAALQMGPPAGRTDFRRAPPPRRA